MFIAPPDACDEVDRVYRSSEQSQGFVMNLARAWAWRPDVFEGFAALRNELTSRSALTPRDQAVIVCATAAQLGDSYCCLAWGAKLQAQAGAEAAAAIIAGTDAAALTPRDRALARWARQVVADPNATTPAHVQALRDAGFADRDIFEATVFVAFRLAFSTVNDALGVAPDGELLAALDPRVREAVRFGRPVAP